MNQEIRQAIANFVGKYIQRSFEGLDKISTKDYDLKAYLASYENCPVAELTKELCIIGRKYDRLERKVKRNYFI